MNTKTFGNVIFLYVAISTLLEKTKKYIVTNGPYAIAII